MFALIGVVAPLKLLLLILIFFADDAFKQLADELTTSKTVLLTNKVFEL
jgi:hypothetical protein